MNSANIPRLNNGCGSLAVISRTTRIGGRYAHVAATMNNISEAILCGNTTCCLRGRVLGPGRHQFVFRFCPRWEFRFGAPMIILFLASQAFGRSEEHTSELQSRGHLVCRL